MKHIGLLKRMYNNTVIRDVDVNIITSTSINSLNTVPNLARKNITDFVKLYDKLFSKTSILVLNKSVAH